MKYITVTTKTVSEITGLPKVMAVNVEHIVSIEPTHWDYTRPGQNPDQPLEQIDGCVIIGHYNHTMVFEFDIRDSFESVLQRIDIAQSKATYQMVHESPCLGCGAHPGHQHALLCNAPKEWNEHERRT